jgi:FKBP-type peptidyl-prolyl cis-trans isomerase FkpA
MMRFCSLLMLGGLVVLGSCLGEVEDSFGVRLSKDIATIDSYLATNGVTDAIKDISGVRYKVEIQGTGYSPRLTDLVTFTYTGKLLDGTIFDGPKTLTDQSLIPTSTSQGLIPGFQVGLPQLPTGSKATLYLPSGYAYGTVGKGNIPPNSILIFEIDVKKIKVTQTELNQLGSDTVLIDNFLEAEEIDAVRDSTGLRYTVTEPGIGQSPGLYNKVKIKYEGYLITPGTPPTQGVKFAEGTNEPGTETDSRVVNYIRGFQFGLMKLKKGGIGFFYMPSGLAFGPQTFQSGTVTIPVNANLIYKVELLDVLPPN